MIAVGVDDTDSREHGMCTTYVGAVLAERLREAGHAVERSLLVRCNPAVEHKTRGNAAVALHVRPDASAAGDADPDPTARSEVVEDILSIARVTVDELAATADPAANPGVVVAPGGVDVPQRLSAFAERAIRDHLDVEAAAALADAFDYRTAHWGNGRGRIGALAAIGAWRAHDDWTVERIAYREPDRWGTERSVDEASVRAAADEFYPTVWDTVDRTAGEIVCVPHTPCPVLYGVRGDAADAVEAVAAAIDGEPVDRAVTYLTNQGTDAHLRRPGEDATGDRTADEAVVPPLRDGRAYRVDGTVLEAPETRPGGHVFFELRRVGRDARRPDDCTQPDGTTGSEPTPPSDAVQRPRTDGGDATRLECVAFEPTKRFRDRVRALRVGDRVTVCGEVGDGTCKLEKFALRDPVRTETVTPTCPECDRRMESAGAEQGYRCRDCDATAPGPEERDLDRDLEVGWYEVPPRARRHVAKPLVRGDFDAPIHPER